MKAVQDKRAREAQAAIDEIEAIINNEEDTVDDIHVPRPQDPSAWLYTIRIGRADDDPRGDQWVAQVLDDTGSEVHVLVEPTLQLCVGAVAVAVIDVHEDEEEDDDS